MKSKLHQLILDRRAELTALEREERELYGAEDGPPTVSLEDFVAEGLLRPDDGSQWLIRTQIAKGSLGFLVADPGLGKTTLLVQISLRLSAGRDVFGYATEPSRTLLVAAEGARAALAARVQRAARTLGVPTATPIWYVNGPRVRDFLIDGGEFEAMLEESKPALVILDTLAFFWRGEENSADSFRANVSLPLKEFSARYGATFVCVHHHRKAAVGDEDGPHRGRGTSAMFADSDFWWRLEKEKNGAPEHRILHCDKNKYEAPFLPIRLTFDGPNAVLVQR